MKALIWGTVAILGLPTLLLLLYLLQARRRRCTPSGCAAAAAAAARKGHCLAPTCFRPRPVHPCRWTCSTCSSW